MGFLTNVYEEISSGQIGQNSVLALTMAVVLICTLLLGQKSSAASDEPPVVPYSIPFLGSAIPYGIDPVKFMQENQKRTFCLNPEGNSFVFNVPLAHASAEGFACRLISGAYEKLTVPVFGTEVVYDVENAVFMEQKKFVKDTFSVTAFRKYIALIRDETREFLRHFPDKGDTVIFKDMSELTIRTASCCLMGKEIRSQLHSNVAQLYHDLDAGLAPINTYFARDRAHRIMTDTFKQIINQRRESKDQENEDVLQTLMSSTYKNGDKMSDNAIAHMMIATLMGGQHTSSTTLSWILFELSRRPDVVNEIVKEQSILLTGQPDTPAEDLPDFDYDQLRSMTYLDCVMKEVLRLHPPIHTVMRKVEKDISFKGYNIPKGHFLCGSQAFSQLDAQRFPDPLKFEPSRFIDSTEGNGEWNLNSVNLAQKSAKSHFLPFGAGRHRCIGEAFAYVQIKTIISHFIREFEFDLKNGHFPKMDYTSLIVVPEKNTHLCFKRRQKS
ncbi:hypothetical protein HDU91_003959 [Kappamyces sp. JEL0680]|nr:hypothetical protein HDU91_003959 [Kappamyces sp. JEL0680]